MVPRHVIAVCFGFLAAAVLMGCTDSPGGRKAVSGTVKLAGEPLKDGAISFVPLDKTGQDTQSGDVIKNGEYKISREHGLKPGKYLIQITSPEPGSTLPSGQFVEPGASGGPTQSAIDLVPEEWNVRSKQQVEVTSDGPNKFDFEIKNLNPKLKKKR